MHADTHKMAVELSCCLKFIINFSVLVLRYLCILAQPCIAALSGAHPGASLESEERKGARISARDF